jgi:hypothetical protein
MRAVQRRVQRLEQRYQTALEVLRRASGPAGPSATEVLAATLADMGVERGAHESLAETTARAMGWTIPQLRQELQFRAAGGASQAAR